MIYCYIRISTDKQEYSRQKQIFETKGYINGSNCEYIEETYTGTKTSRPIFDDLINNKIKEGDTLVVESLTRLSRSGVIRTLDLITNLIQNKKINVYVIKESFYLNAGEKLDANTNLLLGIFSVLGQFERDLLSERTKEALKAKKINGTNSGNPIGRPRKYNSTKSNFIRTLELMIDKKMGQDKASMYTEYPSRSFKNDLQKCYVKYNTKDYKEILKCVKEDEEWLSL